MKRIFRTYSELIQFDTFEERFKYLELGGAVGAETFGYDRYLNQLFYKLDEWKEVRHKVIVRDNGCDLGIPDRIIGDTILVHHMNPITKEQILNRDPVIFDLEYLISTSRLTHNAIHYADESILLHDYVERTPNDTCPWKH